MIDQSVRSCRLREVELRACAEGDELDDVAACERHVVVGDDEPARGVRSRSAQNLVQERQLGPWSPPDRYLRQVVHDGVERPPCGCPPPIENGSHELANTMRVTGAVNAQEQSVRCDGRGGDQGVIRAQSSYSASTVGWRSAERAAASRGALSASVGRSSTNTRSRPHPSCETSVLRSPAATARFRSAFASL